MKKLFLAAGFICLTPIVFAATIHFKDGRSLEGNILQKDARSIKVDLNGVTMTYYADEIKDIDGKPLVPPPVALAPAAVVATTPAVKTPEDPARKRELILKFIDVFGTRKLMTRNYEMLMASLVKHRPIEAERLRQGFKIEEVIERLIPLYDKHFTSQELEAYISFYSSDQGKKLLAHIAAIMQESIGVSTKYLKEKFPELDNKQ